MRLRIWAAAAAVLVAGLGRATVPTTTSIAEYTCNGTTKAYAVPYRFLDQAHLRVSRVLIAAPNTETVLTLTTDYTVSGAGATTGGQVTLVAPGTSCASSSYKLRIRRITPRTQGIPFATSGLFNPKVHEAAFDRQMLIAQELNDGTMLGNTYDFAGPNANAGTVTAVGSTTARRLDVRMADYLNPSDFGAACDGLTDDAAALAAAQTAAGATKGIVITCQIRVASAVGTVSAPVRFDGRGALDMRAGGSVTLTGALTIPRGQQVFFQNGGTLTIDDASAASVPYRSYGSTATGKAPSERVYRVAEFPGADIGAKLQAAHDYALARALAAGGTTLEGIHLIIEPRPNGLWTWTTPVDLTYNGGVTIQATSGMAVVVGANLSYLIRTGVTTKGNHVTIDGLEFWVGNYTVTQAILVGGGTRCRFTNLHFNRQVGETGTFTYGIYIDRSQCPENAGVSFATIQNIHDTGGGAVSTAMVHARGLIGSRIADMRVSKNATYGVYLDSTPGDIQGNIVEGINAEPGLATTTALVHLHVGAGGPITQNRISGIVGHYMAAYGVQMSGTGNIIYNTIDLHDAGYATKRFDNGGSISRDLNVTRDWGSFTPVWGADTTSPTLGNGVLSGEFTRVGNLMRVVIRMIAGTTTAFGTGSWFFQPDSAHQYTATTPGANGTVFTLDPGTGWHLGVANSAGSIVPKWYITSGGGGGKWSPTVPITWAGAGASPNPTGDSIVLDSTYEVQ